MLAFPFYRYAHGLIFFFVLRALAVIFLFCGFSSNLSSFALFSLHLVDGVKKKLNSIIGVKQGDLLGPELLTFYMSAVLETWRSLHSYDLCIA